MNEEETTNNIIEQRYYVIEENQRDQAIVRLLETEDIDKCIIFCRMKREVDRLQEHLEALGFSAKGLHGDIEQMDRDEIIKSYRRGQTKILIATDVAARGLDIKGVTHVFNYHIPFDPQSYVHRIGRTGRAGKSGQAITLVSTEEFRELQRIKKEVGAQMTLSTMENTNELNTSDFELILENINDIEISENTKKVYELVQEKDKEMVLQKLLSYYISENKNSNSNYLGYNNHQVEELMSNLKDEESVSKKHTRKRKKN